MRQVVRESSAFYLLGYSSMSNPADGRSTRSRSASTAPGLDVRARHGYWAPSAKAWPRRRRRRRRRRRLTRSPTALAALTPASSRHVLSVWTGIVRGRERPSSVSVAWGPRGAARRLGGRPGQGASLGPVSGGAVQFDGHGRRPRADVRAAGGRVKVACRSATRKTG